MTLNDIEWCNSPYFAFFFAEFDSFAGQLRHSNWRQTYNVRKNIVSPFQSYTYGQN